MPRSRREKTISARVERVWEVVADPEHMPRWWPGVKRMEGVQEDRFTQVFTTKKGKPVRMDFTVLAHDPPYRRAWTQELRATPFERVVAESAVEIVLEPAGDRTRVVLEQRQKLRGYSRTGSFLLRRATAGKLQEALDGLERIVGGSL